MALPSVQADPVDLTELSLEQLLDVKVVSASKYEQRTSEAPSAVQIITRDEIRRHGWRTLSDALLTLPGLYLNNDHAYDYQGARGFLIPGDYNTRFLLLIDGQRNNDNIYQQALTGWEGWLDMASVERIEYIPGPGSAIYGSNAMFGVINVITRTAKETPYRKVSATVSQQGLAGGNMLASQIFGADKDSKGTGVFMQYSNEYKAGRDRRYSDPMGNLIYADGSPVTDAVSNGLDTGRNQRLFLRVDHDEWSVKLISHDRTVTPSSSIYQSVFDDPSLKVTDGGTQVNVSVQHDLSSASSLYARLGYTDWYYRGAYGYFDSGTVTPPIAGIGYYRNFDDVHGQILDGEFRYQKQAGSHRLLTGLEFSNDLLASQKNNYSVDPALLGTSNIDINTPTQRAGLFAQDEWRLNEAWLMSLGLRMDTATSNNEPTYSPRFGVIWHFSEGWTAKLLNGRAYRSPNVYESQYGDGINYLSNPTLQAETIQTTEGVLEWQRSSETRVQLSLFQNRLNSLIQQIDMGGGTLQYQNGGWAQVRGWEFGMEKSTADSFKMRASMGANYASNSSGLTQDNSPDWTGRASMSMPVFNNAAFLAGELQLISSRSYTWSSSNYSVPSQASANVTATFPDVLTKGMQIQMRLTNVFNSDIQHPASNEMNTPTIPQNGRNLFTTLSYAF